MNTTASNGLFGPLAEPIHLNAAGPNDPAWRDNAYLGIWAEHDDIYGDFHVSTSPNAGGLRARVALRVKGQKIDLAEPLQPGSFESESLKFDPNGRVQLKTQDADIDLHYTPRFAPIDFSSTGTLGGLVTGNPFKHWEQGCDVNGAITIKGVRTDFTGKGFRDRSWGFRDDHQIWTAFFITWAVFKDFDLTAIKCALADGRTKVHGIINSATGQERIVQMTYHYDAAALFGHATLTLDSGETREISSLGEPLGGFFLPLGDAPTKPGPAFQNYNEFRGLDAWGRKGRGIIGYGIIRTLY